ncbi:hypothetical protein Pcinc_002578 [Petrolisthes cinctipes]|uniref:Uncharacterized protein n=1 Tax=Petrolisthes cinctipes TaxID=88211 RepID=A0AAE1L244_PETCI|nr:hypothetical protein Pcinc_002578 [Petrolisthes cinctipes]
MSRVRVLCYLLWVISVSVLLLLRPLPVEGGELNRWHRVLVSYDRITGASNSQQQSLLMPVAVSPGLYCSRICSSLAWCNLWCPNPSTNPTQCILSNIIIMPTYQETNMADALTCHTIQNKDHATNAIITDAGVNPDRPERVKENLVDGIFTYKISENFASRDTLDFMWFVLDFSQIVTFSHVVFYVQDNSIANRVFRDVQVRVGNTPVTPPSGFASYDLFGVFPGAASPGQVITLQSQKPVSARFVSVQMMRTPSCASPTLYYSNTCTHLAWYNLWCANPSIPPIPPIHCILSNIIVMPTYKETNLDDALTCHTRRPKDQDTKTSRTKTLPRQTK